MDPIILACHQTVQRHLLLISFISLGLQPSNRQKPNAQKHLSTRGAPGISGGTKRSSHVKTVRVSRQRPLHWRRRLHTTPDAACSAATLPAAVAPRRAAASANSARCHSRSCFCRHPAAAVAASCCVALLPMLTTPAAASSAATAAVVASCCCLCCNWLWWHSAAFHWLKANGP